MDIASHLAYAAAWALFALGHSGLAAAGPKRLLQPLLGKAYRIAYNLAALAQFALVAWVGARTLGAEAAFALPAWARAAMGGVHLAGWLVLLGAARFYDLGRLSGWSQLRHPERPADEGLRTDGPHAFVRHPLYAGAFLILWGGALSPLGLSPLGLATAIWGSLYLLVGTWLEERKLLRLYGDSYRRYRARVPAYLPWRGRAV